MVKIEDLNTLFQIKAVTNAPEFIIYSEAASSRLDYTANFIFKNVLNSTVLFTHDLSIFRTSKSFKINYSSSPIDDTFQIMPSEFIFEKGIQSNFTPTFEIKNNLITLFSSFSGNISFDVFSAVFYMISRYEEWQNFSADVHERFELKNSFLFKHNQHLKPVVNYWIEELKQNLQKHQPQLQFPKKDFVFVSTIDVDNLYAYKNKNAVRAIGASINDLFKLNFNTIKRRISVLMGKQQDPFDVYEKVNSFCKNNHTPLIYFFLQRSHTKFDRTINPSSNAFKNLFNTLIKQNILFGLHPSYYSYNNAALMKKEVDLINANANSSIKISRQHYLRFDFKTTPVLLMKNGIIADFSIGFASGSGYRAGTFTPFNYYNFNTEAENELLLVPFATMDGVYFNYSKTKPTEAENQIVAIAKEAQKLNGLFISVFHERTFDNELYTGFNEVYWNHIIRGKLLV